VAASKASRLTRRLLRCGVVAGPLFVGTFLLEGATRDAYEPFRHPVSSLAIGPGGWMQRLNFWVTGALYTAGTVGLWRASVQPVRTRVGPVLIGTAALGLVGAGIFVADPHSGYPPGSPPLLSEPTTSGKLHDGFSTPVFLALPAAALVYAHWFARRGQRSWMWGSIAAGVTMLTTFGFAGAGFNQEYPSMVPYGGLFQRISLSITFGWLTALAARALQDLPES
jgi:hypothetical protein